MMESPKNGFTNSPVLAEQFLGYALNSGSLAHAYLFKGKQMEPMYKTALVLAKVLNCTDKPSPDMACGVCQNCRWISENAHPAVMTVSRLTQLDEDSIKKVSQNKGKALSQIPTSQISELIQQLAKSSPYFRVVIFTEVEEVPVSERYTLTPPAEWKNEPKNAKKALALRSLNRKVLHTHASNKMLKTLEEPCSKTLFIFLTDSEESVLETIESRCQTLAFQPLSGVEENHLPSAQISFFQTFVSDLSREQDFYTLVDRFREALINEEGLTPAQALDAFQQYLHRELASDVIVADKRQFLRYTQQQQWIEKAKRMLQASTNTEQVLNQVFSQLSLAH